MHPTHTEKMKNWIPTADLPHTVTICFKETKILSLQTDLRVIRKYYSPDLKVVWHWIFHWDSKQILHGLIDDITDNSPWVYTWRQLCETIDSSRHEQVRDEEHRKSSKSSGSQEDPKQKTMGSAAGHVWLTILLKTTIMAPCALDASYS